MLELETRKFVNKLFSTKKKKKKERLCENHLKRNNYVKESVPLCVQRRTQDSVKS